MADFILKVSPDTMIHKADSIRNEVNIIKVNINSIAHIINSSICYWDGKASNCHRALYEKIKGNGESVITRLGKNPEDLLGMAGIYKENETKLIEEVNQLPCDILC